MSDPFQVVIHGDVQPKGQEGVAYHIVVSEVDGPAVVGHLRTLHYKEDRVHRLRIVSAYLTSEDEEDAALHLVLSNGAWWNRALNAALDQFISSSPAIDPEFAEEGATVLYGWAGGEVKKATLSRSSDDLVAYHSQVRDLIRSMELAKYVFAPDFLLTEQQLERFFDDIAQMLAAKAFDRPSDEDKSENEEGEDR